MSFPTDTWSSFIPQNELTPPAPAVAQGGPQEVSPRNTFGLDTETVNVADNSQVIDSKVEV